MRLHLTVPNLRIGQVRELRLPSPRIFTNLLPGYAGTRRRPVLSYPWTRQVRRNVKFGCTSTRAHTKCRGCPILFGSPCISLSPVSLVSPMNSARRALGAPAHHASHPRRIRSPEMANFHLDPLACEAKPVESTRQNSITFQKTTPWLLCLTQCIAATKKIF